VLKEEAPLVYICRLEESLLSYKFYYLKLRVLSCLHGPGLHTSVPHAQMMFRQHRNGEKGRVRKTTGTFSLSLEGGDAGARVTGMQI